MVQRSWFGSRGLASSLHSSNSVTVGGQVTFLSLSLFICEPHSFIYEPNIIEHLLGARHF